MPVPIVRPTTWSAPRAAPKRASTSVATFASLSMKTGSAESLGHDVAERDVGERQVDAHHRVPVALVDQAGDPEADRLHVGVVLQQLGGAFDDRLDERLLGQALDEPVHAVVHLELLVDDAAEQLGAAEVHADDLAAHAWGRCGHCGNIWRAGTGPHRPNPS